MQQKPNQFIKLRQEKLEKIKALGIDPYPVESSRSHFISALMENKEALLASETSVTIVGRLVAMRRQGKLGFGNLEDASGKIQLYVAQNLLGEENYELFKLCDPGDLYRPTVAYFILKPVSFL
jgi:lysyl-tRNA synthetase class 2